MSQIASPTPVLTVISTLSAKSVVLATGGITRCWSVCSGSWEYTGDGHALALWAGAERDMEFVQFHPTGMVWPPSVRGILVTEGMRSEGGRLTNSEGSRFMFDYVPEMFAGDHADTIEEADDWAEEISERNSPPFADRQNCSPGTWWPRRSAKGSKPVVAPPRRCCRYSHRGEEAIRRNCPPCTTSSRNLQA